MLVLSFVWLDLFVVELIWGLTLLLDAIGIVIWGVFILEFILRLVLAPRKVFYLKTNWLMAISLFLPALRTSRVWLCRSVNDDRDVLRCGWNVCL